MLTQMRCAVSLYIVGLASGLTLNTAPAGLASAPGTRSTLIDSIMSSLSSFNSRDLAPEEFEEMEGSIKALVTTGTPEENEKMAVKEMKTIVDTMIPMRKKAQEQDQKMLDDQMQRLKDCKAEKRDASSSDLSHDHKKDYEEGLAAHGQCVEVEEGKALVKESYCKTVDVDKDCCCDCTVAPENKQCCDAHAAHMEQHFKCAHIKQDYEESADKHKAIMDKVCGDYDTCYDRELKAYKALEEKTRRDEKNRSWQSLYRLKCLLDLYESKGDDEKVSEEEADACDREHDVPKIVYPEHIPDKESCEAVAF